MAEAFSVVVDKNVPMKTRDGTILRSDVYRPSAAGQHPVLLGRTQYNKESWGAWISPTHTAAAGYAVVINDMRGQFASDGEFERWTGIQAPIDVMRAAVSGGRRQP